MLNLRKKQSNLDSVEAYACICTCPTVSCPCECPCDPFVVLWATRSSHSDRMTAEAIMNDTQAYTQSGG